MLAGYLSLSPILAMAFIPLAAITWIDLIVPMGIMTFSLLVITIFLGLFMRKRYKLMRLLHTIAAFLTLAAGAFHASLVLFLT